MKKIIISSILFFGVIPCETAFFTFYKNAEFGSKFILMLNFLTCGIAGLLFIIGINNKHTDNEPIIIKYTFCGIAIMLLNTMASMITGEESSSRAMSIICLFAYYLYVLYVFKKPDDIVKSINITLLFLILSSFILFYVSPQNVTYIENATTRYFKGVSHNRNSYADIALLYIASNIYLWSRNKKHTIFYLLTTGVAFYTTYLTHSATSTICAILLIVLSLMYVFTKKTIPLTVFLAGYVFIFISLIILQSANTPFLSEITNYFDKSTGLTGRTNIWTTTIDVIKNNPVFGRGYDTYALAKRGIVENDPHNSVLYILLTQGFCGIIMFLIMFYNPIKTAKRILENNSLFSFMYNFVIVWMIRGLTESVFSYSHFTFWIAVIIIEILNLEKRKQRSMNEEIKNAEAIQ